MNPNNNKNTTTTPAAKAKTICELGLEVHAATIVADRHVEGLNPQTPQRFQVADFLKWVRGKVEKRFEVISCYEAGPTGHWLHRKSTGMGVTNFVACPTRLDSRGKGVNTDQTDALELLVRLNRYVAGIQKAFSMVRVPTKGQERKRALSRQRQQLRRQRIWSIFWSLRYARCSVRARRSTRLVESIREVDGKTTVERRYYLANLPLGVETFARAVRSHWGVENKVHWIMEVCFREDQSRARAGYAAENLATLRRLALIPLKREKTKKRGVRGKQLNASWDHAYLLRLLGI